MNTTEKKAEKVMTNAIRHNKRIAKKYIKQALEVNNIEDIKNSSFITLCGINRKYKVLESLRRL